MNMELFDSRQDNDRLKANWEHTSGLPTLMWDLTNRCNLSCLHCYNSSGPGRVPVPDLPDKAVLDIAEQVREMKPFILCLCGGEPLMRDVAFEVAQRLAPDGIIVNAVTNGFELDVAKARRIRDAGFSTIQVSLDGATAATHDAIRGRGSFARAVEALRLLSREKACIPAATIIPTRINHHEIPQWFALCRELGARPVGGMPLIPIGRAVPNLDRLALARDQYWQVMWWMKEQELDLDRNGDFEWNDPMEHIFNFSHPENTMCNATAEIRSDGALLVSSYLPLVCGNLTRHSLREYWEAGYRDIWRHPRVQEYTSRIRCLEDFALQPVLPWTGEDVLIDLIPDETRGRGRA